MISRKRDGSVRYIDGYGIDTFFGNAPFVIRSFPIGIKDYLLCALGSCVRGGRLVERIFKQPTLGITCKFHFPRGKESCPSSGCCFKIQCSSIVQRPPARCGISDKVKWFFRSHGVIRQVIGDIIESRPRDRERSIYDSRGVLCGHELNGSFG